MTTALVQTRSLVYVDADLDEEVVHVFPSDKGWHVKPESGKESIHGRKALAALFAKQMAANAPKNGRVIFYRADGSVETVRRYEALFAAK
jgi:hypothetical protein